MIAHSEAETESAAQHLALDLTGREVICLHGDLGMGKSVFARALIRKLCEDPNMEVPSPTFTLLQTYRHQDLSITHFDLYRLGVPEEVFELGWDDALAEGVTIIEWPERLGQLLPEKRLDIHFQSVKDKPGHRQIEVTWQGNKCHE